jgi:predicted SAM-dependent methyltransferase
MSRLPSPRKSRTLRGAREDLRLLRRLLEKRSPAAVDPSDPGSEQSERIHDYLATHPVRKLQLGAGVNRLPGWLPTDINVRHDDVVQLDATEPLPFPDTSIDFIHAEHLIEHIPYRPGQRMLRQCRRVLRPGGVLRLATPDLARLVAVYRGDAGPEGEHYLEHAFQRWLKGRPHPHPAFLINHNLRAWGHVFVYDEELLTRCLREAGYVDIVRCELGESTHEQLRDVERHGTHNNLSRRAVAFETMILEATKPDRS